MEADRCADTTRRANHQYLHIVIVCDKREAFAQGRTLATMQSISMRKERMDCLAEPVIGRRFAPSRWLAMTGRVALLQRRVRRGQHDGRVHLFQESRSF